MVGTKLPVKYRKTLEKMAEEQGVSLSEVVRRIIIRHLESSIEERLERLGNVINVLIDALDENREQILTLNLQAIRAVLLVVQHNLESHQLSPEERRRWEELRRDLEKLEKEAKKTLKHFKEARREAARDDRGGD